MNQNSRSNILALKVPKSQRRDLNVGAEVDDPAGLDPAAFVEIVNQGQHGLLVHRHFEPLYINHAGAAIFGLTVADVMVLPTITGLFHPADFERVRRHTLDRLDGRMTPSRYRFRISHSSDRTVWVEVFARVVTWKGEPACQCTILDVDNQERQVRFNTYQAAMEAEMRGRALELERSHQQLHLYQSMINHVVDRVSSIDTSYRLRLANRCDPLFLEQASDRLVGRHLADVIGQQVFDTLAKPMLDRSFAGETVEQETAIDTADGARRYLKVRTEPFRNVSCMVDGAIMSLRDITQEKTIEDHLNLSAAVIERISDRISVVGTDYRYRLTNKANRTYHGKPSTAFVGRHVAEVIGERDFVETTKPMLDRCFAGETVARSREGMDAQGHRRMLNVISEPYRETDGRISGAVITIKDQTEAHRLHERLAYQTHHDELTGLLNRRAFCAELENTILETVDSCRSSAYCFIDLDQFKIVNDTVGHLVGDQLLKQVSRLLQAKIHDDDILARLGGDEFGLLLRGCSLRRAQRAAENLVAALNDYRFFHEGHVFEVGASVGIAAINRYTPDLGKIMSRADLACYAAKDHGRNRVHVYKKQDAFLNRRRKEMEQAGIIRAALDQDHFALFAQPIKAITQGPTQAPAERVEVLLRMIGDGNELIMPSCFIPAAERYGFMREIDRWVIKQTVAGLRKRAASSAEVQVNINLSGLTLSDDALFNFVHHVLQENDGMVPANQICFEITETAAIRDLIKTETFIRELKAAGCKFALDDFGTGLSSLNYLKRLPVDYLKIDSGFIRDICHDSGSRAMVAAVHQMAKALGIETVAEGVENGQTLRMLEDLGIEFAQGFEIGLPKPLDMVVDALPPAR